MPCTLCDTPWPDWKADFRIGEALSVELSCLIGRLYEQESKG